MSLIPFTFPFALAMSFFEQEIAVTDTEYITVGGRDQQQTPVTRTIFGAVDSGGSQRLEQLFGGSVTDGDIGVFTNATLYSTDIYDPLTETQKQSFVTWNNLQYRVTDLSAWAPQVGQNVYLAKRHVKQDGF